MRTFFTTTALILLCSGAFSQTALNSQTNVTPVLASSSVLNYSGDLVDSNEHDVISYGNGVTFSPTDSFLSVDSTQINQAAIEARVFTVDYLAPTITNNTLRAIAYGNLAVLGVSGGSVLSSQTSTGPASTGVTATTSDVFIGTVISDGSDPGTVSVSGNSVLSSAVGNSASYTITR
jgi:hypothetical protein